MFISSPLAGIDQQLYGGGASGRRGPRQRLKFVTAASLRPVTTIVLSSGSSGACVFTELGRDDAVRRSSESVVTFIYKQFSVNTTPGYRPRSARSCSRSR